MVSWTSVGAPEGSPSGIENSQKVSRYACKCEPYKSMGKADQEVGNISVRGVDLGSHYAFYFLSNYENIRLLPPTAPHLVWVGHDLWAGASLGGCGCAAGEEGGAWTKRCGEGMVRRPAEQWQRKPHSG